MPDTEIARSTRRRQLQQIIDNLDEGIVLLEPGGRISGANQAALAMHGCSSLEDFAASADIYCQRFVLHDHEHRKLEEDTYPVKRLLACEEFSSLQVEVSHRDPDKLSRVLKLSGLVTRDEQEQPESLVLVMQDITARFDAQDRFEKIFAANPAPALTLRLSDSRYIKVNKGFLTMTGFSEDEIIGHALHEHDVLHDARHRDQAVDALTRHAPIAQQESCVQTRSGGKKCVIVAGQPIDVGDEACMLFTFNDIDKRKQAELALRQSEKRFSTVFQLAPVPMLVCERESWKIMEVNDSFVIVTGHAREDVIGKTTITAGMPGDRHTRPTLDELFSSETVIANRELGWKTRNGDTLDALVSVAPAMIGEQACVLLAVLDITERKRSEADLISAIEEIMQDASWLSKPLLQKLAKIRHPDRAQGDLGMLTTRETEVLERLCEGQSNAAIAESLNLSPNTVRNHLANLYDKIGVNRRSAAVIWGRERGLGNY